MDSIVFTTEPLLATAPPLAMLSIYYDPVPGPQAKYKSWTEKLTHDSYQVVAVPIGLPSEQSMCYVSSMDPAFNEAQCLMFNATIRAVYNGRKSKTKGALAILSSMH